MTHIKKVTVFLLTLAIVLTSMPFGIMNAQEELNFDFDVKTDKEAITQGQKGIDFAASYILFTLNSSWKLSENRSLNEIKVMANGKTDETFKFDIGFTGGTDLKLIIKKSDPGQDQAYYRLNPSSLYYIYIPEGLFKNDKEKVNPKIDFSFVTKGEFGQKDLLKSTLPTDKSQPQGNIDTVEFEYVDDITADINKLKQSIEVSIKWIDESLKDPDKPELRAETINDFNIMVKDNKIILQSQPGKKLANFCTYNIKIPRGILHLKNSPSIKNDEHELSFTTYQMLESTYPTNNQGGVEVKPTMRFVFKHPVTWIENKKNEIVLKSQVGEEYPLAPEDINLSSDGRILSINVGKINQHPLRRNTLYKVVVPQDVVKFTEKISNKSITLNFTTRGEGQSPIITRYSSNPNGTDDITSLSNTKLSRDGYIYIHFDRDIKFEKNSNKEKIIDKTKLYKIPKADDVGYDPTGTLYDKVFEFGKDITEAEFRTRQQLIGIDDIQIVNKNTLQIKPSLPLINLNLYRLNMDKHIIEDINGYGIEEEIDFYFWTAPSPEKPGINWGSIIGLNTGVSKDDKGFAGVTYTVSGTPIYGPQNPIAFDIEGEVVPKVGEIASLKRMSLVEGYDAKKSVKIKEFRFEYYFAGEKKRTKLFLYPEVDLTLGKYYILTVPQNTLQARSGSFLPPMVMNFTVAGKGDSEPGIYGLVPNTFKFFDIYRGNMTFTIKGYNFTEDVEYVELKMISGNAPDTVTCAVYKKDIEFKSVTELLVKLREPEVTQKLIKGGAGEYLVKVNFKDRQVESPQPLKILPRGKPVVLSKDPMGGSVWQNEKMLNPKTIDGIERYFLKITFEDLDGSLTFDGDSGLNLLQTSTLFSEGQNEVSMLDREFLNYIHNLEDAKIKQSYIDQYIFVKNRSAKEAYLFVPVKPLRSQTTYTVMINSGIVYHDGPDKSTEINDVIQWSFTTMAIPAVTGIDMGSVGEDYDEDEPLWLQGDFFDERNVEVFFNDIRARKVKLVTDNNGKTFLEVYLPDGRDRLEPGIYTIRVRNDRDHEFEIFGSLSVVKEGEHVPNEEYTIKAEMRIGDILSDTKVSEDTLILDRRYTDRRYVDLDLDDLMGEDVFIRKIQFDGRKSDRIGTLEIISKWADIFLYDVGIGSYKRDEEPELKVGRVEPLVAQNIKAKLGRQLPKSELIQVTGEDIRFSSIKIIMPFKESNGENLKVLRYDPYTRNFHEELFFVDKIDKTVTVSSYSEGIFVVVEK